MDTDIPVFSTDFPAELPQSYVTEGESVVDIEKREHTGGNAVTGSTTAAIVVAFNRKQLLTECLDGLLAQTLPLDAIFVVDNASTDGTDAYLKERGYFVRPEIHYIRLPENGGGAGGFYHGMQVAFETGYDWLWLMDDDTEPAKSALELMEPFKKYDEVVAIANQKLDAQGQETLDGLRMLPKQDKDTCPYPLVRFSSFVGILIRSTAVRRLGLPRSEFFIHNDDMEYCLRLRTIGKIALAKSSCVIHKEKARQMAPMSIFGFTYLPADLYSYCFYYYGYRNYVVVQRTYGKGLARYLLPLRRFLLAAAAIFLIDRRERWFRFRILWQANLDGWRDHFDNTYPFRMRTALKTRSGLQKPEEASPKMR